MINMATFEEIDDAFFFVNSDSYGMHRALLCLDNGRIYFHSEMDDPEDDELSEDNFDCDNFIEIPHKNDLNMGQALVFEFAEDQMPGDLNRVMSIFDNRGAYRKFKDLLECRGLLESWYEFESRRMKEALMEWVKDNEIKLDSETLEGI